MNLHRRHLTASQRAMVATDALPMAEAEAAERRKATEGRPSAEKLVAQMPPVSESRKARDDVARMFDVSPRYAHQVRSSQMRHARSPRVGDIVHVYELVDGEREGPWPALVVATDHDTVTVWIFTESGFRLAPAVPHRDGGAEAGVWWERRGADDLRLYTSERRLSSS